MKNLKKVLAIVLSFAMLLGLASTASAAIVIDDGGVGATYSVYYRDGGKEIDSQSASVFSDVTLLSDYKKDGWVLKSWNTEYDGTGTSYEPGGKIQSIQEDITLYAQMDKLTVEVTIGSNVTKYENLQAAVEYISTQGTSSLTATIKLLAGQDLGSTCLDPRSTTNPDTAKRTLTFDLNGYTITYSGTDTGWIKINNVSKYTIKNGTIDTSSQSFVGSDSTTSAGSTITMEDLTWKTTGNSWQNGQQKISIISGVFNLDPSSYVHTNSTSSSTGTNEWTVTVKPDVAEVTIDGVTTRYKTIASAETAFIAGSGKTQTLKLLANVTSTARLLLIAGTSTTNIKTYTIDLNGYNYTNNQSTSYTSCIVMRKYNKLFVLDSSDSQGATMKIAGNTTSLFYLNNNVDGLYIDLGTSKIVGGSKITSFVDGNGSAKANGSVVSGIFSIQPTDALLATGSTRSQTGTYWKVTCSPKPCQINGVKYDTITAAVSAASSGDTIKMLTDYAKTDKFTTIPATKDITLDLNGKTLTNTYSESTGYNCRYFQVEGTLRITDTSNAKTGSIHVNESTTTTGAITYAKGASAKVYVDAGYFYDGAAQDPSTNNCWLNNTGGTHQISGGWFAENARPTNNENYCATGYKTLKVTDESKSATPYTVSNTYKTIDYFRNGEKASGDVAGQTVYYKEGYTISSAYAKTNQCKNKGFKFMGWSTDHNADPDSTELIQAGEQINWNLYGDKIEFYAIWKKVVPSMWVCVKTETIGTENLVGYADIASAFDDTQDVTLIKNYTGRDTINGRGKLNLNGYNIIPETTGSALVIKGAVSIYNYEADTITVEGTDYNFGGEGIIQGTAQGTGGAIDANAGSSESEPGEVKIYGGTYIGDAPTHGTVLTCSGKGKIIIYGGTFKPIDSESTIDTFYANNGKIIVAPEPQSDVKMKGTFAKDTGTVGIAGGFFTESEQLAATYGTYDATNDVFTEDSSLALKMLSGDNDYKYCVASQTAKVADVETGKTYSTFEEAATAADEGDTLILAEGVTFATPYTFNKDLNVNANGCAMYGNAVVSDNTKLSIAGASPLDLSITSTGFVFIDGVLTTSGIVNQTATAQRLEYVGGDIKDTVGATFYGLVALKDGDNHPTLTYNDPAKGTTTMNPTVGANGKVTYNIESIYVSYIAAELRLQFMQGSEKVGDEISYSLLQYYNDCYTEGEKPVLDATLANTIVYAHELYLLEKKGINFDVPLWAGAVYEEELKTPVASDNITKISAAKDQNNRIASGSICVTEKSRLMFTVYAQDVATKEITLEVTKEGGETQTYNIKPGAFSPGVEAAENNYYNVKVDKISPLDYNTKYTAELKVDGESYHKVDYSVNSYCYRMHGNETPIGDTTIKNVAFSLYNFGKSTFEYSKQQ